MSNLVFNIALGRVVELYRRVATNDPAASGLVVLVLATAGIEADSVLRDVDTVTALVAGTTNEVTNSGYARKVLTNAEITVFAPDDANDRVDLAFPNQTWTAVIAGDGWNDIVIAYDPDTGVADDATLIPLTIHDFVVVPDGSDITAQIAAAGFYRAANL